MATQGTHTQHTETVLAFAGNLRQGKPTRVRGLTVVPLFGPPSSFSFVPLVEALSDGSASVTEVDDSGDVNCLAVDNRGPVPVLIFDGEELVGAKQNRIANTTVLVPPNQRLDIPVSCVEQGRWHYRSREFATGSMLKSDLRRNKAQRVTCSLRESRGYDADQGAVWDEVAAYAARRGAYSETGALSDVVASDQADINTYVEALPLRADQIGLAAYFDGELVCVDALGSAAGFAALHPRLIAAIAAEAVERCPAQKLKRRSPLSAAFRQLARARAVHAPSPGLGTDLRLETKRYAATALVEHGQTVHLALFPLGSQPTAAV